MKCKALIVLFAILIGIVVPPSLPFLNAAGEEASLGTLDLCHKAAPALSSHGDMPCMNERPCRPLPLASCSVRDTLSSTFKVLLLAFQDERPPQA